jgi:hypothetical protein
VATKPVPVAATIAPAIEPGVFTDKTIVPNDAAVEAAIGSGQGTWAALRAALAAAFDPMAEAWSFSGKRYGWSLRLSHRDRPIVYLTPLRDGFRANLAIPERAMAAAVAADLSPAVHAAIAVAPTYPEGRAVRLRVTSDEDVASVVALARIRMANQPASRRRARPGGHR